MEGVGVAGARSFVPPEGEGKVHARDGQTVSLAVSRLGQVHKDVSTPLNESLSRIEMALAGISWRYLAAPGRIAQSKHRSLEACGRLQSKTCFGRR
jgi:hypothetical protein